MTPKMKQRRDQYLRMKIEGDGFDWSDEAFLEADAHESRGTPPRPRAFPDPHNGFLWAKKAMDITITMWKEDILDKLLLPHELIQDGYSEKYLRSIGIIN